MKCFGGFGIIFLPLCDALSCAYTSAKFSLDFSLQVLFRPNDPTFVSSSTNIISEERYQSQPLFPQFLPVLPLASQQWPWAPVHADKLLPLSKSVLRLNHTIPVARSELRLKSCIPRSWNSGFALRSPPGHSEKRNGLKDQKHTQEWVDARCSPGSAFFKCCCVLSKEGEKNPSQIHGVRKTKFLWVQYVPQSGN